MALIVPLMSRLLLRGRVLTPERDLAMATVVVADKVIELVAEGMVEAESATPLVEAGDIIVPGFIDLQVNGFAGNDAASGQAAITEISRQLPKSGVVGFLPTLISRPIVEATRFVEACEAADSPGARVLGAHIEGPFLNPIYRGAHDPRCLALPEPEKVRALLERPPTLVTLAPELPGALDAIRDLTAAGVSVAAGHSAATMAEANAGFDAGICFGTHLFNAMSPMHHREPGLPGALLTDDRATVGLIADGVHVDQYMLSLAVKVAGPDRIALTTDQTAAAGSPPGRHVIAGRETFSDGTSVRLANGTLAGSVATMDHLVRVMAGLPGLGLHHAIEMASATPARFLGLDRGVRAGAPADLVVLTPDLRVRLTLIGGRVVHG
jgi:N-acetylglucosamine-6-phosphate deacetylase